MTHRTVAAPVRFEGERVKGSRFVADLAPVADEAAAAAFVAGVREAFGDASHHCWALRLGADPDRVRERADDDGEPRDSAGAPILRHLAGADLIDVVCVVTRWFGGTKLGRGGLVRAYGDAAAGAIDAAEVVVHVPTTRLVVTHGYEDTGAVDGVLHRHDADVVAEDYADDVTRTVEVRAELADDLRRALREATAGRVLADGG